MSSFAAHPVDYQPAPTDPALKRMRWALLALFAIFGTFTTAWAGRAPSVRYILGLSVGELGAVIVAGSIGALISVSLAGIVVPRIGSRRTLWLGTGLGFIGLTTMALALFAGSAPLFAAGVLASGLSNPFINVTSNLEGTRVEKMSGKPALPQLHAAFPVGAIVGSGLAALSARAGLHAGIYLLLIAVAVTALRAVLIGTATVYGLPAQSSSGVTTSAPARQATRSIGKSGNVRSVWTETRTLLLGVIVVGATMSEGAALNWLNISVVESFGTPEALGALAYGTFVASMLVVRATGAKLLHRFGRLRVLYTSSAIALAGVLIFTTAPVLALLWVGIILWGAGAAMTWPTVIQAAGEIPDRAPQRVALVSTFSSVASLVFPPLLGLLGDSWGIRNALMLIPIALVIALFSMRAARPLAVTMADAIADENALDLVKAA